jgi:5-methylcytosine-specific restriction enzyme A
MARRRKRKHNSATSPLSGFSNFLIGITFFTGLASGQPIAAFMYAFFIAMICVFFEELLKKGNLITDWINRNTLQINYNSKPISHQYDYSSQQSFSNQLDSPNQFTIQADEDSNLYISPANHQFIAQISTNQISGYESRYIPAKVRYEILAESGKRCKICGACSDDGITQLHIDHILPFSKGGSNDKSNLRILCSTCNLGKGNRHLI